ncbi:MAG: PEP-CTERM sorting domain-containing protein [Myxococcota bacterium]
MSLLHRRRPAVSISLLATAIAWLAASPASAGTLLPGVYNLFDHGFASLGPSYGLRVDAIGKIFSVELGAANVTLSWDGGTTATISGLLNENTAGGNGGVGSTWMVSYVLSGVSAVGTQGFTATAGNGTLTDPSNAVTVLTGEADHTGSVFDFLADGFRIPADSDSPVGSGWLLPPGSTDDWLVRAELVPEPDTGLLMGLGLIALAVCGRRRQRAR